MSGDTFERVTMASIAGMPLAWRIPSERFHWAQANRERGAMESPRERATMVRRIALALALTAATAANVAAQTPGKPAVTRPPQTESKMHTADDLRAVSPALHHYSQRGTL
jgi:hypothetical protein